MALRIAAHTIVIGRKGHERMTIKPGEQFDFTDDEIWELAAVDALVVPEIRPTRQAAEAVASVAERVEPPKVAATEDPPAGGKTRRQARRAPAGDREEL